MKLCYCPAHVYVTGPKLLVDILIPVASQTVSSGISDPVDVDLAVFSEEEGKIRYKSLIYLAW